MLKNLLQWFTGKPTVEKPFDLDKAIEDVLTNSGPKIIHLGKNLGPVDMIEELFPDLYKTAKKIYVEQVFARDNFSLAIACFHVSDMSFDEAYAKVLPNQEFFSQTLDHGSWRPQFHKTIFVRFEDEVTNTLRAIAFDAFRHRKIPNAFLKTAPFEKVFALMLEAKRNADRLSGLPLVTALRNRTVRQLVKEHLDFYNKASVKNLIKLDHSQLQGLLREALTIEDEHERNYEQTAVGANHLGETQDAKVAMIEILKSNTEDFESYFFEQTVEKNAPIQLGIYRHTVHAGKQKNEHGVELIAVLPHSDYLTFREAYLKAHVERLYPANK